MNRINSSIKNLLFRIAGNKYQELVVIALNWKYIVGNLLSERSQILKYERKILYVKVCNHVWMQEFILHRPDIIKKMKEKTNIEIDNILFTV
ncbi:MAG: DUF721 domain-containing protein [Candidatus Cloacimonetes bacterium]|jgi:hypothetical protein|nr:DUF721 domain-containing protein [Candidatus Cloacimonadota bacterium]MDD4154956.1 DUF721 domain-containing protein [Candidatus Cloacimonadota bacterium]